MGCYRVPSPTPSVESDAPIPEAPQEVSPGAENIKAHWMIFVGNVSVSSFPRRAPNADSRGKLHPKVTETELYDLFGGRDRSRNVIIRTTRGCGVIPIPEEDVGPRDRCYASIEVKGLNRTKEIMDKYRKNPPKLYGLPLTLGHSPADMPEFLEILERAKGSVPEETEYVNVIRSLDCSLTIDPDALRSQSRGGGSLYRKRWKTLRPRNNQGRWPDLPEAAPNRSRDTTPCAGRSSTVGRTLPLIYDSVSFPRHLLYRIDLCW